MPHPEIPSGYYCYSIERMEYQGRTIRKNCPYWRIDATKPEQENGYCTLFGYKDWEDGGLLWDQVKSCRENMEFNEDEEGPFVVIVPKEVRNKL